MKIAKYVIFMSAVVLFLAGCSIFNSHTWQEVEIGTTHTIEKIIFTNMGNGYLITDGGEIYSYKNGMWNKMENPDTMDLPLYDMATVGNTVYICGGDSVNSIIMKADTNGKLSIVMRDSLGGLTGISVVDSKTIWACGTNVVYYYNGSYWAVKYVAKSWDAHPYKVAALSGEMAYFIANKDSISVLMKYSNGGWTTTLLGNGVKLNNIFFLNNSTGYIVGDNNSIFYYNGGAFIKDNNLESIDIPLYAVYKSDVNNGYVVGGLSSGLNTIVYRFVQGEWKQEEGIKNTILKTVYCSGVNDVWVGGQLGKLFHKD